MRHASATRLLVTVSAIALLMIAVTGSAAASQPRPLDRVLQHALTAAVPRAITSGPLSIGGTVLTPSGAAAANADVEWGYYDSSDTWTYGNTIKTDASGRYGFTGVLQTADGTIDVYPADSSDAWGIDAVFTGSPPAGAYDVKPGRVSFANTNPTSVKYADIRVYTSNDTGYCRTYVSSQSAEVAAMPPSVNYLCARYQDGLNLSMGAVEWIGGPIAVASGALASGTISVDEHLASWLYIKSPYWASGPPGTRVQVVADNWRTPMTGTLTGYPGYPEDAAGVAYGTKIVGAGGEAQIVIVTVPKTVKPGYAFDLEAHRSDSISANGGVSNMRLTAGFEVCTLKASRTSLRHGARLRLSGIVPTQGHSGSTKGKKHAVVLYSRTKKPSGQPTTWDATRSGWKKELSFKTDGYGSYAAVGRPSRTKWYVVRYAPDNWYYGGYTAIVKVSVIR